MILGSSAKYGKFFSLTSFAMLPLLIRNVAATMMVLFIPSSAINPQELGGIAPSAFLDPTEVSRTVFAIAQSLDLITFWVLILLIIAYRNVAPNRTSVITRTIGVLIPWLILVAGRVGLTLLLGSSAEFVGKTVFHRRLRRPRCSPSLKASLASSAAAPALTLGCAPRCRLVWAMGNGASGGGSGHRV